MKVALYVDEGRNQIVLRPESKFEEGMIKRLHDTLVREGNHHVDAHMGDFYECQGGWTRQSPSEMSSRSNLIIVMDDAPDD